MESSAERPFTVTSTEESGESVERESVPVACTGTEHEPELEVEETEENADANTSQTLRESEVFAPQQETPGGDLSAYKKKGSRARKRRYEETGLQGDIPVRDVVLFRYKMKRHFPGLSDDMEHWYEYWYFTKPNRAKDGDKYEKHIKAYTRGRRWIAEEEGVATLGNSGKVLPYRKRQSS